LFVQGVVRGNYGIIGLALLYNMMGDIGLSKEAVILGVVSPLYNIYGTIGLILPHHQFSLEGIKKIFIKILTNPIIIALFLSFVMLVVKLFFPEFQLPLFINTTITNFSSMALPVALIGIGGSLSILHIKNNKFLIFFTTLSRIVVSPLIFTIIAVVIGFRNESLAALFILFGIPTAIASFILAKSMDGDSDLTANVIVTTTVGSIITLSIGIYLLKAFRLI
jgi:predicted permease